MGPSGSGKSTLIKCISTLEDFDSGSVVYGDREISRLGEKTSRISGQMNWVCFSRV